MTTERSRATRRAGEYDAWKALILLTSLIATVAGWLALPWAKPSADGVVVSPTVTTTSAQVLAPPVTAVDEPGPRRTSTRSMPAMPRKPVFEAPVTRTRRS